jgi:bifunctional non-homologous end joining protein LigD
MVTPPPPADGRRFVVQRHRARRLHYDLRLEAAGVLLSWAVPKGPTLDPDVRRLAVHVEDHPLDYFDFEGVIGAGEYGGGDVTVWDWGTWTQTRGGDAVAAVEAGDLRFELAGVKLGGRFALVRGGRGGRDEWLLVKKHDEAASPGWDAEDHPRSVKSGRTNDEVRDAPAATWSSEANWSAPTADELQRLDELGPSGTWEVGGRDLALTGLDDVVVPTLTRRDLVRHHALRAPVMLPYLPIDSPAGLVEVAASGDALPQPSSPWAVMDISAADPEDALVVARLHRTALEHLGVDARPVLVGAGALQVWIPVATRYTPEHTRQWLEQVAAAIAAAASEFANRVQVSPAETMIAPFSVRRTPGAPVAVPLTWDELEEDPPGWTIDDVGERIERAGDPLAPLIGKQQRLPTL